MSELKRCPFCGALPETKVTVGQMVGGKTDNIDFIIRCTECGTEKTVRLKISKSGCFMDVDKAMSQATKAWNRRAEDEAD